MGINPCRTFAGYSAATGGLIAGLFLALIGSQPAAASPNNGSGSIGATSSGSVRITATVAPTFRVRLRGSTAAEGALRPAVSASNQLCLDSNMERGQFSISAGSGTAIVPADAPTPPGAAANPAACIEIGAAAAPGVESQSEEDRSTDAGNPANGKGARPGASASISAVQARPAGRGILILVAAQ